jgi:hypothetical protein
MYRNAKPRWIPSDRPSDKNKSACLFTPPQTLPPLDLSRLPDAAEVAKRARGRKNCIGRAGTARDDGDDDGVIAEGAQPTPSWQPGQLDALRADIVANEDIRAKLDVQRLRLTDGGKVSHDGRAFFFNVKREGGAPGSFLGRCFQKTVMTWQQTCGKKQSVV